MKRLLPYMKGYWKECILGPIFKLLEAVLELMVPMVTAQMIDVGIANQDTTYIWQMGGLLFILAACGFCFAMVCQYFASKCAYGFGTALREALFHHVNLLSHSSVDRIGTATLITRITSDTNTVQNGLNMMIRLGTRLPVIIIGSAVMAARIDLKLSIIFFIAIPVIGVLLCGITYWTIPQYGKTQKKLDVIARHTRENLDGVRVIRAFSKQDEENQVYGEECEAYAHASVRVGNVSSILNPGSFLIMNLGIVAVLWFGATRVDGGSLTQGELTALVNYMTQISLSMARLAELLVSFNKATASAKRVSDILAEEPDITDGSAQLDVVQVDTHLPAVSFQDVTFTYPGGGAPALHNIQLELMPGETLGIIGGTGSGKTSVANLLPRFYDAESGHVQVYGEDVQQYTLESLRSVMGIVPQKATLVSGTIRDNLKWGNPDATDEDCIWACKVAQAWDFVSQMPDGLDSMITQGGRSLSGGQKQRLTIARALIRRPQILILDDSMSALDYATDLALRTALQRELPQATKIIISQRVTSIQQADHILVLEEGECVGYGAHQDLMTSCDVYREIYHTQVQ